MSDKTLATSLRSQRFLAFSVDLGGAPCSP
jgi:hypothetical protein